MQRGYNFSAGPSTLPTQVLKEVQQELLNYQKNGCSIFELSHRSKVFMDLAQESKTLLKELMAIPDNYRILFLTGGAQAQFSMVPMNLVRNKQKANYVVSGHWSKLAMKEADRFCDVNVCTNNSANNHTDIADINQWKIADNAAYTHYCPNETISGLAFDYVPDVEMPLVADMSSVILSAPVDVKRFGLIYACAQKNLAPAGLTVVIIKENLIKNAMDKTPRLFSYQHQLNQDSLANTPPTFSWYVAHKVLKWLKAQGGLEKIAIVNKRKASKLYQTIDDSGFYQNNVQARYRSIMNVPFYLGDESLNDEFLKQGLKNNLLALAGHKSVGGMRASIYNAMPEAGVDALVSFMKSFEKRYG